MDLRYLIIINYKLYIQILKITLNKFYYILNFSWGLGIKIYLFINFYYFNTIQKKLINKKINFFF